MAEKPTLPMGSKMTKMQTLTLMQNRIEDEIRALEEKHEAWTLPSIEENRALEDWEMDRADEIEHRLEMRYEWQKMLKNMMKDMVQDWMEGTDNVA